MPAPVPDTPDDPLASPAPAEPAGPPAPEGPAGSGAAGTAPEADPDRPAGSASPSAPSTRTPAPESSSPEEVTADNAAEILAAEDDPEPPRHRGLSRRRLLAAGGVVAAAAAGAGAWLTLRRTHQDVTGTAEELPLVIGGDICAAPLYAAYHQGYFDDAGLNVTLARTQRTEDTKDAVGAGRYIGAPGIFFAWLEPIYNGVNARMTAGIHSGCLRLVVPTSSRIRSVADLKGTTIGVPSLSSSAFAYFAIELSRAGVDPDPEDGDITWKTIDEDSLPAQLAAGEVDAITGSDPAPYLPLIDGTGRELANNDSQPFCCAITLNSDFIDRQPQQARALTEAWMRGSQYTATHIEELARIEVDNDYVAAEESTVVEVLGSYGFDASAVRFREALEPGIEDFKSTGFISSDVATADLASSVFADLGITR